MIPAPLPAPLPALLLAAGASRRMGRPKALLPWPGERSSHPGAFPGRPSGETGSEATLEATAAAPAGEPATEPLTGPPTEPRPDLPTEPSTEQPLIRVLAETLAAAGLSPVFVVLGHARKEVAAALAGLPFPVEPVENPAWRSGMLSSVKAGIRAVSRRPEAQWALLTLVDQPFLTPALIRRLVEAAEPPATPGALPPAAVAPADPTRRREGRFGHPVLLSRRLFPEILEERPRAREDEDRGARRVLARHRAGVRLVPAAARELVTLETPADYDRARRPTIRTP